MVFKKQKITLPKNTNKKLAEFIGIIIGDGYIGIYPEKYDYRLEITGHKVDDYDYLTRYVSSLIKSLFNIKPRIQIREDCNVVNLRAFSKILIKFIESKGFPVGKKGEIDIPDWIKENNGYMLTFIKGLFDTDGSLALKTGRAKKRKYEPCIKLSSSSKKLSDSVYNFLIKKGFSVSKYIDKKELGVTFNLQIFKKDHIFKWMKLIGSSNKKHLLKYKKVGTPGLS